MSSRLIYRILLIQLSIGFVLYGCQNKGVRQAPEITSLFTQLPADFTGIDFQNDLTYTQDFNPYTFRNFYNGGGVAIGDINNDGLSDIYFCGNQVTNQLYLNRGDFSFEDITQDAGVGCEGVWSTGVSMADVNGDGWLDIYVCKSGRPEGDNRYNELFINDANPDEDGIVTFTEQAEQWGINDLGLSAHAVFFDYDRDGDLDCYLLNNSLRSTSGYDLIKDQRLIPDSLGGNKLYRHEGDHFVDVSREAGIYTSSIGFGLGVTIGDLNRDGWLDIYVSNDFFERDYLYLNQQDGTFSENLPDQMPEISLSSMGADMADLNGDGYPEIFVTDMLPEGDARMKTKTRFENWDKYQLNLRQGYHRQYTRNSLQLNNGDNTYSEISRLTGVYGTDWSWGALLFDFENDGLRDIFVANGIYKDLTDQDYIDFSNSPQTMQRLRNRDQSVINDLIDSIPSQALPNYAFSQLAINGSRFPRFENRSEQLGLAQPSFSNGSAYGDLDNDGDLDLVINNVNMPAFIYRNETDTLMPNHHWLGIRLKGEGKNAYALGSRVTVWANGSSWYQELAPMRGFQSCVDPRLLIGLGQSEKIDSLLIQWPDGTFSRKTDVSPNQYLSYSQNESDTASPSVAEIKQQGALFSFQSAAGPDFVHVENEFQDFRRDRMLFHMRSTEGPGICQGDFNRDGRMDVFIGGAKEQTGGLYLQQANGNWVKKAFADLDQHSISEDVDCECFDANGDGHLDLYVASGGNEYAPSSSALYDRLYLNDGRGNLRYAPDALPGLGKRSTGTVAAADFDRDGDVDIFVGTRLLPFSFGTPVDGLILSNNGRGIFEDVTDKVAPELRELGLLTSAEWADLDGDRDLDLIVAGEWSPITVWINENGKLTKNAAGLGQSSGWWHSLHVLDVEGDGDLDIIAGNWGLNSRFQASPDRPARMYVNDFDHNGTQEQVITVFEEDEAYPLVLRPDLVGQMPVLKRKYLKHAFYQEQTIEDMFTPTELEGAQIHEVHTAESAVFLNNGDGEFSFMPLPTEAQLAPIFAISSHDLNGDEVPDLVLGGNMGEAKPEVGGYFASYGVVLLGTGDAAHPYRALSSRETNLCIKGAIRDLAWINTVRGPALLVARNNQPVQLLEINNR